VADVAQERTERPTQRRLEEARRHGQLPRSRDLTSAAVVLIAGAGLRFLGAHMGARLYDLMQSSLTLTRPQLLDENLLLPSLAATATKALVTCAPVLGLTVLAALLAPLALGGWNLSFEALAPDFTRLSPVGGFGRIFSLRSLVELAKALAKFVVVATVAVIFLWKNSSELMTLGAEPARVAIAHAAALSGSALLALAAALGLIAAADVPWQVWQHNQRMRMSRQELRDEHRESEGSPEIKGRVRRAQQEVAKRRMMQELPKADVVVVNPTHFAVALRYDEKRMRAPIVVAKGADEVAQRIREVAAEHRVAIFEAPPLARALFRSVPIGAEIPTTLYVAVAQVLTYVYQLRTANRDGAPLPPRPSLDPTLDQTRH
jgi:flagellar biosynthetic protein FlhB